MTFSDDFYEHMKRDKSHTQSAKTMTNIVHIWSNYVTEILTKVQKNGVSRYGTKTWFSMATLDLGKDGNEEQMEVDALGKFFLSRS